MKRQAAVLGSPIAHSLSPVIHLRAYEILGLPYDYQAVEVTREGLSAFLTQERFHDENTLGFSLTMPLKEEICSPKFAKFLNVDQRSQQINSANTLYRDGDAWQATSTDVTGFEYLLSNRKFANVVILGSGGTARAVMAARQIQGAEIRLFRRSSERDEMLSQSFPDLSLRFMDSSISADILVNTVPNSGVEKVVLGEFPILLDAIYSPWLPALSKRQMQIGGELLTGIDLLCAQAIYQVSLMTKENFEFELMFNAMKKVALAQLV
jgi:shikimate dehydrogenase